MTSHNYSIEGQVNFKLPFEKKMPFNGFMVIVKQKIIHRRQPFRKHLFYF